MINENEGDDFEFELQKTRIKKILEDTINKLKLLTCLPVLLENNGEVLLQFLTKTEVDFIVLVCHEHTPFIKLAIENRTDLVLICNMLDKIKKNEYKSSTIKKRKSMESSERQDVYLAYAIDIIFSNKPLVKYMISLNNQPDFLMQSFLETITQLEKIILNRLNTSAIEEVKKDNDLKTAYRMSMMLSKNIQELEDLLQKQRDEMAKEYEHKEEILQDLMDKIDELKTNCTNQINKIVNESEVSMMKEYNKSSEKQEIFSQLAAESTKQYELLLESHLQQEKALRVKRLKVETQLASWIAKYDTDIGEKQAEYDELERIFNQEKEELELLQDKLDEQEEEYFRLMQEKEEEEQRLMEERAWIFLQNRSARRIQRAWRAYKLRKLARKRGRKSKKKSEKSGSAGKNKKETNTTLHGGPDPNAFLESKFGDDIIGDVKVKEDFTKKENEVDLMKE